MNHVQDRFDAMDLNLLRVFAAVYRERHLTRAARALALSPSAVSHALRRLRGHLADPLFERSAAAMLPTATCLRMAPALIGQLAELRGLLQRWGEFDPATTTLTFRIGVPDAIEPMLLPRLRAALAGSHSASAAVSVVGRRVDAGPVAALERTATAVLSGATGNACTRRTAHLTVGALIIRGASR